MAKEHVDELERRRVLWAALTPAEWEAKGAEAEKRIAKMDDDELMDELCQRSPKPNVDELVMAGLLIDEAIKRRLLVPLTLEIADYWIDKWEEEKGDKERVSTRH
jgi:hypothetical protein